MKYGNVSKEYVPETGVGSFQGRILVLEDDAEVAEVIRDWFEMQGATVTVALRGVEALKHVARVDFDAIICDMVMPQMPGDMFYIAVGKLKPHMADRFVFITGYRDRPDVARFLWEYCGPTLDKPLSMQALTDAVHQVARLVPA
jgi:CheY-like chemotaxis protein